MRHYIRHPSDVPIEYRLVEDEPPRREPLKDIGHGGLCFRAGNAIPPGSHLRITIPVLSRVVAAEGTVVWSRHRQDHYEVGVRFSDEQTEFAVRMAEQVCHIERFRQEVREREGRALSGEEAAREWIKRHAHRFPR